MRRGRAGPPHNTHMAFRRREVAPPDTHPARRFGARALIFAFAVRSERYRKYWGAVRFIDLAPFPIVPHLTVWRLSCRSRAAERAGFRSLPPPPDIRRLSGNRPFQTAPPQVAITARLSAASSGDDDGLTLADLPGERHLVLTPGLWPVLYLFEEGTCVQITLIGSAPQLFGRFKLDLIVPLDDELDRALDPVSILARCGARSKPERLALHPDRIPTLLRVLDLKGAGLSSRKAAIDLFGRSRVEEAWSPDSYLKSKIARLRRRAQTHQANPPSLVRSIP